MSKAEQRKQLERRSRHISGKYVEDSRPLLDRLKEASKHTLEKTESLRKKLEPALS